MKNIAIIGSRRYPRIDLITNILVGILPPGRTIITGDAAGVDRAVAECVTLWQINPAAGHHLVVCPAQWSRHGKAAGSIRNQQIVAQAEAIIAFWDLHSPGTEQVIKIAQAKDMPLYIYGPAGELLPDKLSLFGKPDKPYLPDLSGPEFLPLDHPDSTGMDRVNRYLATLV